MGALADYPVLTAGQVTGSDLYVILDVSDLNVVTGDPKVKLITGDELALALAG